jgi:hypothetical protein
MRGAAVARVFTPEAVETIRQMSADGISPAEIAREVATTKPSLVSRCYQLGIKLPLLAYRQDRLKQKPPRREPERL